MAKQALLIGLGRFGLSVASALTDRGTEVLAVDRRADRVKVAAETVAEAVTLDATDAEALERTAPGRRDLCLVALGDDSIQASILCTALLREMGAKRIIARASDALHGRILRRVGAHEVIDPLRDFGVRFASNFVHGDILGELPLGRDLVITEMHATGSMVGKSLRELDLRQDSGLMVVAFREHQSGDVCIPDPDRAFTEDDVLIVVSRPDAVTQWMEKEKE